MKAGLAGPMNRGCLFRSQFNVLYDDTGLPSPHHEQRTASKVTRYCLCKYSAKCSVEVDQLDITLFCNIIKHVCPHKMNLALVESIKEVRNYVSHCGNYELSIQDFECRWKTLQNATLGLAGEISSTCTRMFKAEISRILNSSKDEMKEVLMKSNDNQIKILDAFVGLEPSLQTTSDSIGKHVETIKQIENRIMQRMAGNKINNVLYFDYHDS
ncbi:Hypothetical predicted protein [Mytilus galloprovincialis]|uniref:DZIP3-like HEPN domain-containing protein n=1 Tax=Mytilus galloprovincialis TaxID=29158 RepID=A0A8B6CD67_MYTGA|nr:Hypothetical predicted protein [Mytilus galloprovincialis]